MESGKGSELGARALEPGSRRTKDPIALIGIFVFKSVFFLPMRAVQLSPHCHGWSPLTNENKQLNKGETGNNSTRNILDNHVRWYGHTTAVASTPTVEVAPISMESISTTKNQETGAKPTKSSGQSKPTWQCQPSLRGHVAPKRKARGNAPSTCLA